MFHGRIVRNVVLGQLPNGHFIHFNGVIWLLATGKIEGEEELCIFLSIISI